ARTVATPATAPTPDHPRPAGFTSATGPVTIEAALDVAAARAGRGEVVFPGDLRGFPGTVHGGAVAALRHPLTRPRPRLRLRLPPARGAPPEPPLRLGTGSVAAGARLELGQADRPLAQAEPPRQLEAPGAATPAPDPTTFGPPEGKMPRTPSCLACG